MEVLPEKKRFIESSCLFTNKVESPFATLSIDDTDFLNEIPERGVCLSCNRSRRYYCYNCYVPVKEIATLIPSVKLPVKIDIIKHPKEVDGKSTSAHAAVLAPNHTRVFIYPDFPDYAKEKVLLIFPGKMAQPLQEILNADLSKLEKFIEVGDGGESNKKCPCENELLKSISCDTECDSIYSFKYDRVVFIDSTWRQSKKLYGHPVINSLPCCVLTSHKSLFWRHQRGKPESHLSTVEAIYYFLVELHQLQYPSVPYCGRYDNLLFFFKFMYYKIRTLYDPSTLKAYQS